MATYTGSSAKTFEEIHNHLRTFPAPLSPPGKSYDPKLTDAISSLYAHPTLEALLHLLNHDLPSAHFLVRHMQAAPANEGMYTHGILHRIEGDYNNARAWYADVSSADAFSSFWGEEPKDPNSGSGVSSASYPGSANSEKVTWDEDQKHWLLPSGQKVPPQASAREFLDGIEALHKRKVGDREALSKQSGEEIEALVQFCVKKFGSGKWTDVRGEWVQPSDEAHKKVGQDMVSGGKGFRDF